MVREVITGNYAQSYAAKLARAQVVAAYPITPQTSVVEKIADFVESGEMDAQYVKVESEHSAMQACISAAITGARTYTATSSQGLALMHELLMYASGMRTPVVMGVVNRAMAPPWSVWADHTDTISERDTGWIQFYAESNQEVLDTVLQAYRIAEDPDVMLPAMITEDAFYLSHTVEPVDIPGQAEVDAFLPPFDPPYKLDVEKPVGFGSLMGPDHYMEYRYLMQRAMDAAERLIPEVDAEYVERFGRSHGGMLDLYRCEGADAVLVAMGTIASTARDVVDGMREAGQKVGLAKLRVFRPFPKRDLLDLAREIPRIGIMDRSWTFGSLGAAHGEVAAALYRAPERPLLKGYVAGVGGRDVTVKTLERTFAGLLALDDGDEAVEWVDLRTPAEEGVTRDA
jgi:2-oxoisovalerate ferredoxin oxidoreductase alpha subunit